MKVMSEQLKREKNSESNFTEDLNSLTDKIQFFIEMVLKKIFRNN